MAWNLRIAGPAQKEFLKLPPNDQRRVKLALLSMQEDPFQGDIKRLRGTSHRVAQTRRELSHHLRSLFRRTFGRCPRYSATDLNHLLTPMRLAQHTMLGSYKQTFYLEMPFFAGKYFLLIFAITT